MKWIAVAMMLMAEACGGGGFESLLVRLQRSPDVDVVVGAPILDGALLWPFDWAVRGSTVVAVRDDDHDGRFSYYGDRSSRCATDGPLLRCDGVRDRVLLRVIDGELSEVYSQGSAWLETCVTGSVGCSPVAAKSRGNTRLARACDSGVELSMARLSRKNQIDGRQIADWLEERGQHSPRTTYIRHVYGADVESAVTDAAICHGSAANCSEWVHTLTDPLILAA